MENSNKNVNNNTSNNTNNTGNNIDNKTVAILRILIGSIVLIGSLSFIITNVTRENETFDASWYVNTTWKTTDGEVLEIKENSCSISKDGKLYKNKCSFTTNSNNSGVGVIKICDEYGTKCDEYKIEPRDYKYPEKISLYYKTWYKQES